MGGPFTIGPLNNEWQVVGDFENKPHVYENFIKKEKKGIRANAMLDNRLKYLY